MYHWSQVICRMVLLIQETELEFSFLEGGIAKGM